MRTPTRLGSLVTCFALHIFAPCDVPSRLIPFPPPAVRCPPSAAVRLLSGPLALWQKFVRDQLALGLALVKRPLDLRVCDLPRQGGVSYAADLLTWVRGARGTTLTHWTSRKDAMGKGLFVNGGLKGGLKGGAASGQSGCAGGDKEEGSEEGG